MKIQALMGLCVWTLSGCQLTGGSHGSKELAGRYPTAIHEVAVEFNNTIPQSEKYQHPLVEHVKLATKRFEGESQDKVFVDLRYEVAYKNGATQFCPLRYSWAKATKVVLLEGEGDCENQGDIPSLTDAPAPVKKTKKPVAADDAQPHKASEADKQNAREAAEVFFLDNNPGAEVAKVEYVETRANHGEVSVTFYKSEGSDVLICTNLLSYEFASEEVTQLEIGECAIK